MSWEHQRNHRGMRLTLLLLLLVLSACGTRPSSPVIEHSVALRDNTLYEGTIIKVWDGLTASRDPRVSHLIEVRLRSNNPRMNNLVLCFPYDEWSTGTPPPNAGQDVVFMPSQWVAVDPRSHGRPR